MAINDEMAVATGGQSQARNGVHRGVRQAWIVFTTLLAVAVFAEACFAGAMLSGFDWAHAAHKANAAVLMVSGIVASLAAIIMLRRVPQGRSLASSLSALAVLLIIQAGLGTLSAKGANLLWLHVPLGAALVAFAMQAALRAHRLRHEP